MDALSAQAQHDAKPPYVASEIVDYGDVATVTANISGGTGLSDAGFDPTYTS